MTVRLCLACKKPLIRRANEYKSWFAKRRHCNPACRRKAHEGRVPGFTMKKKEVPCTKGCGAMLMRAVHFSNAICPACEKEARRKYDSGSMGVLREQARRYRILLAVGPYKEWEELLQAVRIRNPHTWAARHDMTIEQRRRSA